METEKQITKENEKKQEQQDKYAKDLTQQINTIKTDYEMFNDNKNDIKELQNSVKEIKNEINELKFCIKEFIEMLSAPQSYETEGEDIDEDEYECDGEDL